MGRLVIVHNSQNCLSISGKWQLKDRIIWDSDDFIAGFVPQQANNSVRVLGNNNAGAAFLRDFDPFRQPGIALPGMSGTDLSGVSVIDAVQVDATIDTSGVNAYSIGGTKFHQVVVGTNSITNAGAFPHTLAGAGVHGAHSSFSFALGSIATYNVASNVRFFYSYNDGTDWDVGMFDGTSTFDDDFMSSVPATPLGTTAADLTDGTSHPHPLFVSSNDDLLWIGSGRYAHTFDGATGSGTFSSRVLTFPVGYESIGFAETGYDLVAFICNNARSGRRGTAKAFFYGAERAGDPYKTINLDDDEVGCPFRYGSTIGCFTRDRNSGRSALRLFNGVNFEPKFYWTGNLPGVGGVEIQDNLIKWNSDGLVYVWGSKDGEFSEIKFQPFRGSGTSAGFLRSFITGHLYLSSGTTTSGGLQVFSGNYSSNSFWQGLNAFPVFPAGKVGRVREVKITFWDIASGGRSFDLTLTTNGSQTTTTIVSGITSVTAADMVRMILPKN